MSKNTKEVNWTLTIWLSFFLGWLGVDRFVMGKIGTGILKLITFGGLGIWWLIDLIMIMSSYQYKNIEWKFPKNKTVHIVIICVLLVLGVVANLSGTDSTTTNTQAPAQNTQVAEQQSQPSTQTQQVETPKDTVYSMNQDIDVDYITYKITKTETFTEMGTSMFNKETEGKFVKVYLRLTNNAQETKQIFTPRFKIEDSKGRKYDRVSDDMMYIADYLEFGKQLQPGLGTSGAIVFELPKDSENLKLIISGDWVSTSEVKVELSNIQDIGKDTTQKDEQDEMMDEAMADAQQQMDEMMQQYS